MQETIALFIALSKLQNSMTKTMESFNSKIKGNRVWKSKKHHTSDTEIHPGYFIMGIDTVNGQITYHLPLDRWEETSFADELEHAPKWDRHTPADVLERLAKL